MIEFLSYIIIIFGSFLILTSVIGCVRFNSFLTKMHAVSIGDNLGCPMILAGVAIKHWHLLLSLKILMLIILMIIVNPVASYLLNRIALKEGEIPEYKDL